MGSHREPAALPGTEPGANMQEDTWFLEGLSASGSVSRDTDSSHSRAKLAALRTVPIVLLFPPLPPLAHVDFLTSRLTLGFTPPAPALEAD